MASSRPVATAIVGDGGLAVANPVATAIAGLSIEEVSDLGIPIKKNIENQAMFKMGLPMKGKYGLAESSINAGVGVLVGPEFKSDARLTDSEIQEQLENKLAGLNSSAEIVERTLLGENEKYEKKEDEKVVEEDDIPVGHDAPVGAFKLMMAIAPNEIIPNQYPLIPPQFNAYNAIQSPRVPWINDQVQQQQPLPYQHSGYESGPALDQFNIQNRANDYAQMLAYNSPQPQAPQQFAFYPFAPQFTPAFNPYNFYAY